MKDGVCSCQTPGQFRPRWCRPLEPPASLTITKAFAKAEDGYRTDFEDHNARRVLLPVGTYCVVEGTAMHRESPPFPILRDVLVGDAPQFRVVADNHCVALDHDVSPFSQRVTAR